MLEKWDVELSWMGFVVVVMDEKEIVRFGRWDIVVSWWGIMWIMEWLVDV